MIEDASSLPAVDDLYRVRSALEQFGARQAALADQAESACQPREEIVTTARFGPLADALGSAAPLLNLFKQDFTYSGLNLGIRDGMLVTAIRSEVLARQRKEAAAASGGARTLGGAVDEMARRLAFLPDVDDCQQLANILGKLAEDFAAFRSSLDGLASVPGKSLMEAAEDQYRRFGAHPAILVLAIDGSGASLVERRNLLTVFGAEVATVSSGLVVSYELYEPQEAGLRMLKSAGVLSCVSGAVGIREIHKARAIKSRATCY